MQDQLKEAQDIINVLVQELNTARQDATNAKIQLASAQRELVGASAKIATHEAQRELATLEASEKETSNIVPLSASDAA